MSEMNNYSSQRLHRARIILWPIQLLSVWNILQLHFHLACTYASVEAAFSRHQTDEPAGLPWEVT
jgi:hypothetical protein